MSLVKLPDFDDMIMIAEKIGQLKTTIALDKAQLDRVTAAITDEASTNPICFVGDKPPSMAYIKSNYHVLGLDQITREELDALRTRLADSEGKLRELELVFDVYRAMIDVWRTESANQRNSFFEG